MPFGLSNAPVTLQSTMKELLKPYLRKLVSILWRYIDLQPNVRFSSKTISTSFFFFSKRAIFSKLSKCLFIQESVEYLGHIISFDGVAPDQQKIEAMVNWPVPTSLKQLRGFLGLTGFYCRFINNYASIAYGLIELFTKDAFCWMTKHNNISTPSKKLWHQHLFYLYLIFQNSLLFRQMPLGQAWEQF